MLGISHIEVKGLKDLGDTLDKVLSCDGVIAVDFTGVLGSKCSRCNYIDLGGVNFAFDGGARTLDDELLFELQRDDYMGRLIRGLGALGSGDIRVVILGYISNKCYTLGVDECKCIIRDMLGTVDIVEVVSIM